MDADVVELGAGAELCHARPMSVMCVPGLCAQLQLLAGSVA